MRSMICVLVLAFLALGLAGCSLLGVRAGSSPTAYNAQAMAQQGLAVQQVVTRPAARSAIDGADAPGPQELFGLYLPAPGTGLAAKFGIVWDGETRPPTTIPIGPFAGPSEYVAPEAITYSSSPCDP